MKLINFEIMCITNFSLSDNFKSLIFLGDIHGDFQTIYHFLIHNDLQEALVYQVGDFGVGYHLRNETHKLTQLNEILWRQKSHLVIIRGNHDNPWCFEQDRFGLSNIHFLSDYTILNIILNGEEKNIFGVGGAISIDRKYQAQKGHYFIDEKVKSITDLSVLNLIQNINIIVSHTSPDFVYPYTFNRLVEDFAKNDPTLKSELMVEREQLGKMMNYLIGANLETLTHYYYGHFHTDQDDGYKGVKFKCLGINKFSEYIIENF